MRKKFIIIFSFLIILVFSFFFNLFSTEDNDVILKQIKQIIPNSAKTLLKEPIFKFYYEKKELKIKNFQLKSQNKLLKDTLVYKNQVIDNVLDSDHYIYNDNPYLIFKNEKEIVTTKNKFNLKLFTSPFINKPIHPRALGSAFIEESQNHIYLSDSHGRFFYFKKTDLNEGLSRIDTKIIPTNLKDVISYEYFYNKYEYSIKDLLIHNKKIYLSFINEKEKDCFNTSILVAELNRNFLNFEYFFNPIDCVKKNNDLGFFNPHISAGRIEIIDDKNLVFSTGGFQYFGISQDIKNSLGKILKINIDTKNYETLSLGHRNVQGLEYNSKNNYIISSEHGPIGGDEININLLNNFEPLNFGWPISSYGNHYDGKEREDAPLYKSHTEYDFKEPIYYFDYEVVGSHGISAIEKFNEDEFFIGTLNGKVLYKISFNFEESSINDIETYKINERIRDLKFSQKNKVMYLVLENTPAIGIFKNELQINK